MKRVLWSAFIWSCGGFFGTLHGMGLLDTLDVVLLSAFAGCVFLMVEMMERRIG